MKTLLLGLLLLAASLARGEEFLPGVQRIVVLGDSITHAGGYVEDFETWAILAHPERVLEVLNLGLPSETVSGLSEEGHADGKFPRPVLRERLARVLEKTKPDLVFACYGMNDGIYLPLDDGRFEAFRTGIRELHAAVEAAGAKIIHLTPPIYDKPDDPVPYGAVLDRYSAWLVEQRAQGWQVIDLHTPMAEALARRRTSDPAFTFQKDGVHPDAAGHRVLAEALVASFGGCPDFSTNPDFGKIRELVQKRSRILRDSWLQTCGHLRPGMPTGKPLAEAQAEAAALTEKLATLCAWTTRAKAEVRHRLDRLSLTAHAIRHGVRSAGARLGLPLPRAAP